MKRSKFTIRIIRYLHKMPKNRLMVILSIVVGFVVGLIAVLMKNLVFGIQSLLTGEFSVGYSNYKYVLFPAIGILLTIIFVKFILRKPVRDGIPNVLYAISKKFGILDRHNMFSSIITASLTVGFGGSVGLEGPTVVTGSAWGSTIGKLLGLNHKQVITILGFSAAAAMSAIFKAPIAAIVFALEVILFDMTMTALVPLLLSSIVAALTSYALLGQDVLYPSVVEHIFKMKETPYYFGLGIFTALVSVYFIKFYVFSGKVFEKIKGWVPKFLVGAGLLGGLIFLFPSLYGEGYEDVNMALSGKLDFLFNNSLFYDLKGQMHIALILLFAILMLKVVATSVTFRAGGVGGIFAPTLFIGTMAGLLFASVLNHFGHTNLPLSSFALAGMAGLLAGVVHAPLTAIFLIAEITNGYQLMFPIMIVATVSYGSAKFIVPKSIYTIQMKKRGDMITHHKDKALLTLMNVTSLIERNFSTIGPDQTLGELINVIKDSSRNIFPVVDKDNNFYGIVFMDQIRHIMFQTEMYETTLVKDLMFMPTKIVEFDDDMETVASKFQHSGKYNLVVLNDGKYLGFVSRANVFSQYRKLLKEFSDD
ncbi:MAG: chloride channel protein [Bacteroidales bacterium]|nr:chloride channel protein [Bacteroidales bacterium]